MSLTLREVYTTLMTNQRQLDRLQGRGIIDARLAYHELANRVETELSQETGLELYRFQEVIETHGNVHIGPRSEAAYRQLIAWQQALFSRVQKTA